ncbi:serine hydrolase domain-containing protein [Ornithinibacillus halophilus]|uniref:CubicO group peptidase, beta-lactamase class C family n=1 Tax=Ornithinibacillus halophilus TaxID=930117 RepID=A0A1M5FGM0_9BACI|nr:serine hydrolase domain-containing protein [Ornithinibacillus halophilus]SHF90636.1 CubicO group peptidase, beta-lactamase class C family [Ornithinibacillus halophilus]
MVNEKLQAIEDRFRKMVQKDKEIHNAFLLVHSDKHGIHLNMAEGMTGDKKATSNQAFYTASIGKLFTSVLITKLMEKQKLAFDDPIAMYLEDELLYGLHVYKETDYSDKILIKHLLNHTSGINDYFEDKPQSEEPMHEKIWNEPNRFWQPTEVIQWSKEHLGSHFPPGEGFHYSDTGYHLLGLIIERVTGKPFHNVLREYIFQPLQMNHSFLLQYSQPITGNDAPTANVYYKGKNMIDCRSIGIDYASGGVVAPSRDLLKFMKAIVKNEIIDEETFEKMQDWAKFAPGVDYGYGLMKFTPKSLVLPKKYEMWGNAGIVGSFMFYHPELETYIIGSLNNFFDHRKGIKLVFKVLDELMK